MDKMTIWIDTDTISMEEFEEGDLYQEEDVEQDEKIIE